MSNFENYKKRSIAIRKKYHELEQLYHGSEWTIEEDALAFLTDAGLVGRNTMSHQKRWPKEDTQTELEHKLGECMWWLVILLKEWKSTAIKHLKNFYLKQN